MIGKGQGLFLETTQITLVLDLMNVIRADVRKSTFKLINKIN